MAIRVLFFGTPTFSTFALRALIQDKRYIVSAVITQPDKRAGRGRKITASPVKEIALENNIPILQPCSVRKQQNDFIAELDKHKPHTVAVVSAFGQILPEEVLFYPEHDSVNIHGSLLPRWRGAAPIQRAIIEGDKTTGICLMKMEAGLDTGPVYSRSEIAIDPEDTTSSLHDKLGALGAELLVKDLEEITQGNIQPLAQTEEGVTYAKKILTEDAKIDWTNEAQSISRLIHGLSPAPAAFANFRGKRIKIFTGKAQPAFSTNDDESVGTICMVDKNQLSVKCGTEVLTIGEVQIEGKKRVPIKDFIMGYNPQIGESFK